MPSVPPAVRNPPTEACHVCRRRDGESALLLCSGGCGILRHAACAPKRRGGTKRMLTEEDEEEEEEEEVMVLEAIACDIVVEVADQPTSPPTASGAAGHVTPTSKSTATPPPAAAAPRALDQPVCEWQCERCSAIVGQRIFARAETGAAGSGVGFFWPARVLSRDPHGQVKVAWEPRSDNGPFCEEDASDTAAGDAEVDAAASSSGAASSSSDTPAVSWVSERHSALLHVPAAADELRRGKRALAVWLDGHGYACEILGSAAGGKAAVQFDDGLQYDCPASDVRGLLDEPLFQPKSARQRFADDYDPAGWSQRIATKKQWSTDSDVRGPLQRTLERLLRVFRPPSAEAFPGELWKAEAGPVDGVLVVRDFLDIAEVRTLRLLFAGSHPWGLYNWGNVGLKQELASVMQRIDFGLPEMTAEGVAAVKSSTQPLGELQLQVISLLEMRLRRAFGTFAWGGEGDGAPPALSPNMMQFTRIAPATCLGNHFDRRDKWQEGIASIGWSEGVGFDSDPRGDPYKLQMQLGPPGVGQKTVAYNMPAGSAYIMGGHAQGRTEVCKKRCVAHASCQCCWTHGIWNETSQHVRQSITLRCFDTEWGRHAAKEDDSSLVYGK